MWKYFSNVFFFSFLVIFMMWPRTLDVTARKELVTFCISAVKCVRLCESFPNLKMYVMAPPRSQMPFKSSLCHTFVHHARVWEPFEKWVFFFYSMSTRNLIHPFHSEEWPKGPFGLGRVCRHFRPQPRGLSLKVLLNFTLKHCRSGSDQVP